MTKKNPFSLSAVWNYRRHASARAIIEEIKSLGFESIELNFALTEQSVCDFIKLNNSGDIHISSSHNFCPLPDGVKPSEALSEYYSLASLDDAERNLAIRFTRKSMDYAKLLGAKALILHIGDIKMEDKTKRFFCITDRLKLENEKKYFLRERETKRKPFLDTANRSLEALLKYADETSVNIALENRYYLNEIPSLDEMEMIFKNFQSKHLFYWHDVGHAQLYENLSILRHEDYLVPLSKYLIGMHLHDIILFDDHRAPGLGEFDFRRLKPFIREDTIKVIEVHRSTTAREIQKSVDYLKGVLG